MGHPQGHTFSSFQRAIYRRIENLPRKKVEVG
jgi:hypothetical protein